MPEKAKLALAGYDKAYPKVGCPKAWVIWGEEFEQLGQDIEAAHKASQDPSQMTVTASNTDDTDWSSLVLEFEPEFSSSATEYKTKPVPARRLLFGEFLRLNFKHKFFFCKTWFLDSYILLEILGVQGFLFVKIWVASIIKI